MFELWHALPRWVQWMTIFWLLSPISFYYILPPLTYLYESRKKRSNPNYIKNRTLENEVVIIVLGDLGHSPRMLNHCLSFIKLGYFVQLCGYLPNSKRLEFLTSETQDQQQHEDDMDHDETLMVNPIPIIKNDYGLPFIFFALYKVISQIYHLTALLMNVINDNTKFILIQNPPSLPILLIVCVLQKLFFPHIKIVIDWHNLNYTILNLRFQNLKHPFVRLMKWYEKYLSVKFSYLNLAVTKEMGNFLNKEFGIPKNKVVTLYDKPSIMFHPLEDEAERTKIMNDNSMVFKDTIFQYDPARDKLIVSSTSFTPDEDFSILIDALIELDNQLSLSLSKSRLAVLITGKGPQQEHYQTIIDKQDWKNISIKIVWLPLREYPRILRIADLGISLHYSSSGIDLPMKIVDLFGSGVPVISLGFQSIGELVEDGVNGVVLQNNKSHDMAMALYQLLFDNAKEAQLEYIKLKQGAVVKSQERWDYEWNEKLSQLFKLKKLKR